MKASTLYPVGDLPTGTRFLSDHMTAEFIVIEQVEDYTRIRRAGRDGLGGAFTSRLVSSHTMVRPLSDFARAP